MTKKSILALALLGVMTVSLAGCNVHGKANVKVSNRGSEIASYVFEYNNNSENPSAENPSAENPSAENPSGEAGKNNEPIPAKGTVGGYEYSIYGGAEYFQVSKIPGYYMDMLDQPNSPYMYFITSGEKHTGGYDVLITGIEVDDADYMTVTVEFTSPEPTEAVTEAFTYPMTELSLDKCPTSITIRTTGGVELECLND